MNKETAIPLPECHEGPEAYGRFDATMKLLMAVPKTTILKKQKEYRKKVDANTNRRGPKRKSEFPPEARQCSTRKTVRRRRAR